MFPTLQMWYVWQSQSGHTEQVKDIAPHDCGGHYTQPAAIPAHYSDGVPRGSVAL